MQTGVQLASFGIALVLSLQNTGHPCACVWVCVTAALQWDPVQVFFVFGDFYKFFETDRIIFREMLLNLGYAMLGIVVISVLLLISPRAVVIIVVCIATVDLFLFAEMWLFNIRCARDTLPPLHGPPGQEPAQAGLLCLFEHAAKDSAAVACVMPSHTRCRSKL